METAWARGLLYSNLLSQLALFAGALWSIAFPDRRVYPMMRRDGWWLAMWILFGFAFLTNPVFVVLDWDSGSLASPLRFWIGAPVVLTGSALVLWAIATFGLNRTSGLPEGFLAEGPYRLSRNPQYVGDFLLFAGIAIIANSGAVAVTQLLMAFVLLLGPFAEEPWLEEVYGKPDLDDRRSVPRYL